MKKKDLTLEKMIAKEIARGKLKGAIEDVEGSIYFWNLKVNIRTIGGLP